MPRKKGNAPKQPSKPTLAEEMAADRTTKLSLTQDEIGMIGQLLKGVTLGSPAAVFKIGLGLKEKLEAAQQE